jgi:hypothetical protein
MKDKLTDLNAPGISEALPFLRIDRDKAAHGLLEVPDALSMSIDAGRVG